MPAPAIGVRPGWAPGSTAQIDWSHPLAQGVADVWLPGYSAHSVLGRPPTQYVGHTSFGPTAYGRGAIRNASYIGINIGQLPAQTDTTSFTFLAVVQRTVTLNSGGSVGYRNGGGPGLSFVKLCNVANAFNSRYQFNYYSSGSDRSLNEAGSSWPVPEASFVVVGVKSGLTLTLWTSRNGPATATYTTGQLSINAATCYLGGDENANETLVMSAAWLNRGMSHAEAAQLIADPYCFLRY